MPMYVYRCKNCGHRFEINQHMTDDPLTACPQCDGEINRIVFANGIVFHGSGFYVNEYNKKSSTAVPAAADAASSATTESAKPAATDAAPASATPPAAAAPSAKE